MSDETAAVEWRPGPKAALVMSLLGVALGALGLVGYGWLWAATAARSEEVVLDGMDLLLGLFAVVGATAVLMVIHELVHGLVIRAYGGRPRYGATMIAKVVPAFYCTAPGQRFTKAEFTIVALAPMVLISAALAAAIMTPAGAVLILPAVFHLAGCGGDIGLAWVVSRQPRGTLVEDSKDGVILLPPAV